MTDRRRAAGRLAAAILVASALASCGTSPPHDADPVTATTVEGASHHHGGSSSDGPAAAPDPTPVRLGPQGLQPQFVVKCHWSHNAHDDPIVWPGLPGASHLHEFFGSTGTDASSTGASLVGGETTCENTADTAAYWVPALFDGNDRVVPRRIVAYYRTGVGAEPADVEPWPLGLKMLAGNAGAEQPQSLGVVGWGCGSSDYLTAEPHACSERAPLTLRLTFPDCWDGHRLDSKNHRDHVAYSTAGRCPEAQPTPIVQLILTVQYEFHTDPSRLALASGSILTGHGDVMNGWSRDELSHLTRLCLQRGEICGVSSNRTDVEL